MDLFQGNGRLHPRPTPILGVSVPRCRCAQRVPRQQPWGTGVPAMSSPLARTGGLLSWRHGPELVSPASLSPSGLFLFCFNRQFSAACS